MGLIDVLNGMRNGPHGQRAPSAGGGSGSGMSPLTMAMLALLAYKAVKSFTANQPGSAAPPSPGTNAGAQGGGLGGGLGDLLKGGLGSVLAGGAAGGALSGGLNDLLKQFQQSGQGEVAKSWVGSGPNKSISSDDLAKALGADRIDELASISGMSRTDLLDGLSQHLPGVIDQLTPNGRVPTEQEAAHLV